MPTEEQWARYVARFGPRASQRFLRFSVCKASEASAVKLRRRARNHRTGTAKAAPTTTRKHTTSDRPVSLVVVLALS